MLTVEESSETEVFRHLSNHIFRSPYFGKYRSYERHLLWKMFKIWCGFQKWSRKFRNIFSFLDNFIWIGCVKFSLLPREYLSSAVNVLTQSHKISGVTKRNFSQLCVPHSNGKIRWKLHQADFSSVWKNDIDFRNLAKIQEKDCCFLDICISIGLDTFSLLRREHLLSAVNVFTQSFRI